MACDILDWRCIFVNELIGSVVLAIIFGAILYFVFASKMRLGFDSTLAFSVPVLLVIGIAIGGLQALMAGLTILIGLLVAFLFNKMIGN